MGKKDSRRWQRSFRDFYVPRRHTALLVAITIFIGIRPLIGQMGATIAFGLAMVALLIVALYTVYTIQVEELAAERTRLLAERRRRNIIGWEPGRGRGCRANGFDFLA
jgi:hypothetical protein